MITVTQIKSLSKYRMQVFLNEEPAFIMSPKQLSENGLYEGLKMDQESYEAFSKTVEHLAAKCAMDLLLQKDYSENSLYNKLLQKGFAPEFARAGIDYVSKYHYLDDERYARHLLDISKGLKSRQQIIMKMKQKGLSEEVIRTVMEDCDHDDSEAIRREIAKKIKNPEDLEKMDVAAKQKLVQSLMRKGFRYSEIMHIICR